MKYKGRKRLHKIYAQPGMCKKINRTACLQHMYKASCEGTKNIDMTRIRLIISGMGAKKMNINVICGGYVVYYNIF